MITDLFWDMATSTISLGVLAAIAALAFLIAHVPAIVERLFPSLEPFTRAAALIHVAAAAALMLFIGYRIADERAETRRLKNDLAWHEQQLEQQTATAEDAERLKQEADEKAAQAKGELDDFRKKYGDDPAKACAFTPDDLERLRKLAPRRSEPVRNRSALARMRAFGGERR
ncbi:hypothetical protein QMZ05_12455 [Bradyrhizobium sp. INPA03-11B]|uniref:hypothetical protein n=1 Tax=Bradyrhizobium sp. INPA03-11B TaxID=418598 RepID=UPI0033903C01